MKRIALCLTLAAAVACSGGLDPWDNGWGGNNGNGQGGNGSTPEETEPSSSDVDVEDEESSTDNIDNSEFDCTVKIIFNGNSATIEGSADGLSIEKDGARVTATNSGENRIQYILSGSSSDGCFKISCSEKKQALVLDGLTLTNTKGAAINNQSKKKAFVVLNGTNTLGDGDVDSDGCYPEETEEEDMKAAFFSEGQIVFSGDGSLSVNAVGKAGITSDDYIHFMSGPEITVNSAKGHGIRGKEYIMVTGGDINVTLASTAEGKKCFTTDSLIFIGGGVTTLVNKAGFGIEDSEYKGSAGIKADQKFVIQGGELNINCSGQGGKCISGDIDGFFEGGTVTAKTTGSNYGSGSSGNFGQPGGTSSSSNSVSAKAIKFDGALEFSGATVIASASSHEAIESKSTIYISGGAVSATSSSDDAINSSSTMTISDGVVYAYSTGNDGLDANGNLIIKGGTVYAIGCGSPEVGIDANTESNYKFYLQGGNVISLGGVESGSSVDQAAISTSWSRNTTYSLCDSDEVLFTFKTPASAGSGLFMSASSLVSGTKYSLKTSATVSGADEYFDGVLSIGGTATGGNSSSVSASSYSSSGGQGGGGGGGGGGGRW